MASPPSSLKSRHRPLNRVPVVESCGLFLSLLVGLTVTACDREEKPAGPKRSASRSSSPVPTHKPAQREIEGRPISPESERIARLLISKKLDVTRFWSLPHDPGELRDILLCLLEHDLQLAKLFVESAPDGDKKQAAAEQLLKIWRSDPQAAYQWLKGLDLTPYQRTDLTLTLVTSGDLSFSGPHGEDTFRSWAALVDQLKEESLDGPVGALETTIAEFLLKSNSAGDVLDQLGSKHPVSDQAFAYVINKSFEKDFDDTMAYLADRPEERTAFIDRGGNNLIAAAMIKQRPGEAVAWAMSLDNPATDCPAVRSVVFELIPTQRNEILPQVAVMAPGPLKDAAIGPVIGWLAANGQKAAIPAWLNQITSAEVRQKLEPAARP
ncbi:MAG: hypothetical protein QM755_04650 [Luteolibacter sp.]